MACVRKRTSESKTWDVIYYVKNAEGVNERIWETGFKTEKLANQRAEEVEYEKKHGYYHTPSGMTVSELFSQVLSVYGSQNWEPKTFEQNQFLMKMFLPEIGDLKAQIVTPLTIEKMFKRLRAQHSKRGKPYSGTTLKLMHGFLKKGFALGAEWGVIKENPVKLASPEKDTAEAKIWTPDLMFQALNEMRTKHDQLYLASHFAFVCAARIGETVGTRWECVDFRNNLIRIDRTLQRVQKNTLEQLILDNDVYLFPTYEDDKKSVLILKKPKTKGSNRTIQMSSSLRRDLLHRQQLVAKQKAYYGKDYQDHDLVFCLEDGRPVEPKLCEKWFSKFQKRSEAERDTITFHEIRHSSATFLVVLAGGNPAAAQKVTGHRSPDTLMRIYNHATQGMQNSLARRFETVFYSQDIANAEEVKRLKTLSSQQISDMVSAFDSTLDIMLPQSVVPEQSPGSSPVSAILNVLEANPELRDQVFSKLAMQQMQ